jgi:hypothetical protein
MARKTRVANVEVIRVISVALASRVVFLIAGILSDAILPDYDTSSSLHSSSCSETESAENASVFGAAVASSIVWDSVYFERIARCGYEFEHYYAFFPGWPMAMRLASMGLGHPWTQVAGLALASTCFAISTALLYRCALLGFQSNVAVHCSTKHFRSGPISAHEVHGNSQFSSVCHANSIFSCDAVPGVELVPIARRLRRTVAAQHSCRCIWPRGVCTATGVLASHWWARTCSIGVQATDDKELAAMAAVLLCGSPASVFLTYSYTEAMFQMLTFAGIWSLIKFEPILAVAPFVGACAVRSNGALLRSDDRSVFLQ